MHYHFVKPRPLLLGIVICSLILGCSNSEYTNGTRWDDIIVSQDSNASANSLKLDYLPLDDSEYPYAGIPRVVIETINHQAIKDRETEIPAKLQIWGKSAPQSTIMTLTVKGRGHDSWGYPKKSYSIKFNEKQSFLGMPKAKKWVMQANYRDRTLIRNAVALELARRTSLAWTPNGKFADVFFNKKFIGNYYICEKIEVKNNRLELTDNSYLLEFDMYYDEEFKFRTEYNNLPVNIKYPKDLDSYQVNYIKQFVDSAEYVLQRSADDTTYLDYINQESFVDYFTIYALSTNDELMHPKSVYMHKESNGKLQAGPVWDFDYDTFDIKKIGLTNRNTILFRQFSRKYSFKRAFYQRWITNRESFSTINSYIDSLSNYIRESNEQNIKLWPIKINAHKIGDEEKNFEDAIEMLKSFIQERINEMDTLIYTI
ncbi:CotH kinase family protein [Fibrobacter sp.]|uniref:CotH kinase family protein n=1 Tax=Fibrobacter sp. TaxID=35828 RepID=UPI003870BE13